MTSAAHATRAHATLAPSAAARWTACPASVKACEGAVEQEKPYANEGTAAHELAEHCLNQGFDADKFIGVVIDIRSKSPGEMFSGRGEGDGLHRWLVDEEMAGHVQVYVDFIRRLVDAGKDWGNRTVPAEVVWETETRLDMSHIHPQIWGTGDSSVLWVEQKHLHVSDFKYGAGVFVEVEGNKQLRVYAAGAVRRFHNRCDIEKVTMHIVQPRIDYRGPVIRSWTIDRADLLEFEGDLAVDAGATDADDAPFHAGPWCVSTFCGHAPVCVAYRDRVNDLARDEFGEMLDPKSPEATPERLGEIMAEAETIKGWFRTIEKFAHAEAERGNYPVMPDGRRMKLVAKTGRRKWKDEANAEAYLEMYGLDEADLYARKFKSPNQIEKIVGKANVGDIEHLYEKVSSGTNLVPEDAAGEPVKLDAASEFTT